MSPISSRRREAIKDLREWLNDNLELYQEMKKRLEDKNAVRKMLSNIQAFLQPILAYNPVAEPQVAVYVVAQAKANLEGFFADLEFVGLYEEKLDTMKQLKQEADSEAGPESVGEEGLEGMIAAT